MSRKIRDLLDRRWTSVFIVSVGILIRVAVLYFLKDAVLFGDAAAYNEVALKMLAGESFTPVRAPGLPLWLACWQAVFGAVNLSAMLSMLPFYPLLSILVFYFTRRLLNRACANISLVLLALYPAFVFHSVWPLTQVPMAVLLMACLLLMDREWPPSPAVLATTGMLLGIAVLIRPNSISLPVILAAVMLFHVGRKALSGAAILLIVSLIPAGIMMAREYQRSGNIVFINYTNSMNFYLGNNPHTPMYKTWWFGSHSAGERGVPAEFSREWEEIRQQPLGRQNSIYLAKALNEISSRPDVFIARTLNRIRCFFTFDTYTGTVALQRFKAGRSTGMGILALDGLFYCFIFCAMLLFLPGVRPGGVTGRRALLMVSVGLAYAFPFWIAFSHPTYHLPLVPLFAIPASGMISVALESPATVKRTFYDGGLNWKLLAALSLFIFIQLEWIYFMLPSAQASF